MINSVSSESIILVILTTQPEISVMIAISLSLYDSAKLKDSSALTPSQSMSAFGQTEDFTVQSIQVSLLCA